MAALALLVLGVAACERAGNPPKAKRPNILLILTDDQRYDTLSCTGNTVLETPNIDRLAREGTLFENAFVTTPLCCPSRASILTGKYGHRTAVLSNDLKSNSLRENRIFPQVLRQNRYETAFVGKWHMAIDKNSPVPGFSHWVGFSGQGSYEDQALIVNGERIQTEGFLTDILTDRAVDWIRGPHRGPFFLMVSLKNCHWPFEPPVRHAGLMAEVPIELPESLTDPPEALPKHFQRGLHLAAAGSPENRAELTRRTRAYWELVLSIDDSVGRLVEALEEIGELDNTLVVLTSDNGLLLGEHGFQGKNRTFEPSIRVPMLMRYPPSVPAGRREEALVLNVDLAPTFLDLAGVEVPGDIQGASLLGLLRDPAPDWRTSALFYTAEDVTNTDVVEYALRTERFKYIWTKSEGFEEALFDLQSDPDERINLAGEPSAVEQLNLLRREMLAKLEDLEVPAEWWTDLAAVISKTARAER